MVFCWFLGDFKYSSHLVAQKSRTSTTGSGIKISQNEEIANAHHGRS
jgi:hypothetical protein